MEGSCFYSLHLRVVMFSLDDPARPRLLASVAALLLATVLLGDCTIANAVAGAAATAPFNCTPPEPAPKGISCPDEGSECFTSQVACGAWIRRQPVEGHAR